MEKLNFWVLFVAAIIPLITGFLWYGPMLFQNAWMKESNMTIERMQNMNPLKTYGLAVVFAMFLAFFLMITVFTGGAPDEPHGTAPFLTFKHGLLHGAMVALFVALPVFATNALFEQKSFKYVAINVGYWVVTMALMAGVINQWGMSL